MALTPFKISRLRAGIKQHRLAHHLGMTESKLSGIETGRKSPEKGFKEKFDKAIREIIEEDLKR